jgi:hypothetical protein
MYKFAHYVRETRGDKKVWIAPPKLAEATPWDKLCVDLIGPYKIRKKKVIRISYAGVSLLLTLQLDGLKSNSMMTNSQSLSPI